MPTLAEQNKFVNEIAPLVQEYAAQYGYRIASPVIAQACLESKYGLSGLAKYHNYFGMKCGSAWHGKSVLMRTKEEYTVGTLTTIKDSFRAYDSMREGVQGYYIFIASTRYANLKLAETPRQYFEYIKADGYATSSIYVQSNMNIVKKHSLERFDNLILEKNGNPYPMPTGTIKAGSKGNAVRWLQFVLNSKGYRLVVDGIAGAKTIAALREFQAKNNLEVDGVCGNKTKAELIK